MIPNTITTMTSILNIHKQKRKKQNLKNNRSRAPGYYTQKGIKDSKIKNTEALFVSIELDHKTCKGIKASKKDDHKLIFSSLKTR